MAITVYDYEIHKDDAVFVFFRLHNGKKVGMWYSEGLHLHSPFGKEIEIEGADYTILLSHAQAQNLTHELSRYGVHFTEDQLEFDMYNTSSHAKVMLKGMADAATELVAAFNDWHIDPIPALRRMEEVLRIHNRYAQEKFF